MDGAQAYCPGPMWARWVPPGNISSGNSHVFQLIFHGLILEKMKGMFLCLVCEALRILWLMWVAPGICFRPFGG